ncbi:TIGR01620 family protein [Pseudidiomarina taiwanensis]|uniref:TIGR01620 family protein n=1 Tax=Pseudidiomarina taiwanensis TaxID=337250 RepID=A0A432ZNH2_9GAMM|nr:TIGR01620 family protein [Pseudidiomarina taiwanensis]RUO79430.1 TIGR01620 family protein [Pseudidiomarina taiwanensis]
MKKAHIVFQKDDDFTPLATAQQQELEILQASLGERKTKSKGRPVLLLMLAVAAVLAVFELAWTLYQSWQNNTLLGMAWAVFALLLMALGLTWAGRELRSLQRLKQQQQRREQWQRDPSSFNASLSLKLLRRPDLWVVWHRVEHQQLSAAEQQQLFEREILRRVDQDVQELIARAAVESAVFVALSPVALLDAAGMAWRNQKLVTAIAQAYGIELGYWSRIRLWRQVLSNLALVAMSEVAIDMGTSLLGTELMGRLSLRAGQGFGAGILTARLGIQAQALCRPLHFNTQQPARLSDIQPRILSRLGRVLPKFERQGKVKVEN